MRDPSGTVQESPVLGYQGGKDYASKVNFNCMATSGDARCQHASMTQAFLGAGIIVVLLVLAIH